MNRPSASVLVGGLLSAAVVGAAFCTSTPLPAAPAAPGAIESARGDAGVTAARDPGSPARPVEPYVAELRAPGSWRAQNARWAAAQVDSIRVRGHVRDLSTHPDGSLRTRYYLRDETETDALEYVEDRMTCALSALEDSVWCEPFVVRYNDDGVIREKAVHNVVGLHRGCVGGGAYILCGHYDSIGKRTEGWDWRSDPAPGADDNATGVACVLECARILGGMTFDFDLRFIAFTGEEVGMLGSQDYVGRAVARGDTILGVFNIDMVGYNSEGLDETVLLFNDRSEWLADWLVEMADTLDLGLTPVKTRMPGELVNRSDHYAFLMEGYPTISCWESVGGDSSEFNPHYHTLGDTLGNLSIALVSEVASLFAGALGALGEPAAQADFEVPANGVIVRPREVAVGSEISVLAVVKNRGPGTAGPVDFTATLREGPPGSGLREVASREVSLDLAEGTWEYVTFAWTPGRESMGLREIGVRVVPTVPGMDADLANNEGGLVTLIESGETAVFDVYVYPNPARHLDQLTFHYQLSHAMDVEITVYSLEGQELASFARRLGGGGEGEGTQAGPNEVGWGGFDLRPASLAPGLYLYSIEAVDGTSEHTVFEKFAVVR